MPSIVVTACRCIPDEKVRRAIELRLSLFFFSTPARRTVFSLLRAALSLHFSQSISSFESKRCRHSKNLQQPLEAFRLKLSLSSMARRTFSSVISTLFLERSESRQRIFSVPFFYVVYCLSQRDEKGIASTPPVFSQPGSNAKRHSCGDNLTRR